VIGKLLKEQTCNNSKVMAARLLCMPNERGSNNHRSGAIPYPLASCLLFFFNDIIAA
jgi:hypothetical protein